MDIQVLTYEHNVIKDQLSQVLGFEFNKTNEVNLKAVCIQ